MIMSRSTSMLLVSTLAAGVAAQNDMMAGYTPLSDVTEHSELDLDVAIMEEEADKLTVDGFNAAYDIYSVGNHSEKTGSIRTLQGFSTSAQEKLSAEPYFIMWSGYWGADDYADQFTSSACQGTGDFANQTVLTRSEGCLKGAQYQNVWMYVIHELEDAILDCNNGDLDANDAGVIAWDEGWAFYAGSLEGTAAGGSDAGQMLYALAEKRCENFMTCSGDDDDDDLTGVSAVNTDILALWQTGQAHIQDLECGMAEAVKEDIVSLMIVPLVQGLLRYTYLADPVAYPATSDKEASELWAFSAAILPRINDCDPEVATTIRDNTDITSADAPMLAGYAAIKTALESTYTCMGITCAQVGGLVDEDLADGTYLTDFEPCVDSEDSGDSQDSAGGDTSVASTGSGDDSGLSGGGVAGVTIAVGAVAIAAVAFFVIKKRKQTKSAAAIDDNLGNF